MRRIQVLLVVFGVLLAEQRAAAQSFLSAFGAEDEKPAKPAESASAHAATAVPVGAIPWRARDTEAQLREAQGAQLPQELDEIKQLLPGFLDEVMELNQPVETSSSLARRREVHDQLVSWDNLRDRLSSFRRTARLWTEQAERYKRTLQNLQATWSLTRTALLSQAGAPAAALSKTDELLRAIDAVQLQLSSNAARLFELEERLNEAQSSLDASGDLLRKAQQRSRRQLVSRDGRPIWELLSRRNLGPFVIRYEQTARGLQAFWVTYRTRMEAQLVALALVIIALRALAARARKRAGDAGQPVPAVLRVPVLAGLLIASVFVRFTYTRATHAAIDVLGVMSLGLVTWLTHDLSSAGATRFVRVLAAVLLLYRACALSGLRDGWLALALLFTSVVMLAALVWAENLSRRQQLTAEGPRLRRAIAVFLRASVVGMAIAVTAGVLGYYTLLQFLLEGFALSAHWLLMSVVLTRLLSAFASVAFDAGHVSRLASVQNHGAVMRGRVLWLVNALGISLWCLVALHSFELLVPTYDWLRRALSASATLGSWSISLGGIGAFFLTMYLCVKAAQTVGFFLDEDVLPRMGLSRGVPSTVSRLTRYAILAAGFIFAVGAAGVDMSKVALVASALSVGIGFGLQNVVNNFVSGLILIFERPVRVGDTIQVGDLLGDVQSIGIRASTLRTPQGAEAIVPNAELISNRLINWTLSDVKRRIDVPIGVAYGTDPKQVLALLKSAVADLPGVSSQPAPSPIFVGFGESALNFELRVWALRNDEWPLVRSAVAMAINAKFAEANVEIPFPQRDLHLRSIDPAAAVQLAGGEPGRDAPVPRKE